MMFLKQIIKRNYSVVKVANSLTRTLTDLPLPSVEGRPLSIYCCGPTVYDDAHLGHARTYVSLDIILKILKKVGGIDYELAMNVTNIDDKISRRAEETGQEAALLADRFEGRFFEDLRRLGVDPPAHVRRVTDHIPQIHQFIDELKQAGYAYNGGTIGGNDDEQSVYLDSVRVYRESEHPFLHGHRPAELTTSRTETAASSKRNAIDCSLWKGQLDRPGWHIECSTIARCVFGDRLDVHVGGVDLRFPHHENEILQCEALRLARGQPLDQWWPQCFLHIGHLRIAGKKMSKSLKNFTTVRQFLDSHQADVFRWFCLLHKYDQPVEWSPDDQTAHSVQRKFAQFRASVSRAAEQGGAAAAAAAAAALGRPETDADQQFRRCLLDTRAAIKRHLLTNFNTVAAIEQFMSLMNQFHVWASCTAQQPAHPLLCLLVLSEIDEFYSTFGLKIDGDGGAGEQLLLSHQHQVIIQSVRQQLRAEKRFHLSDQLRQLLPETMKKDESV